MITLPAILAKLTTKKDKSIKLEFETREFRGDEVAKLLEFRDQEGWLLFSPNPFSDAEVLPDEKADAGYEGKSPSERLRGALWHWWDQQGRPTKTAEEFYRMKMEGIIEQVKAKLE